MALSVAPRSQPVDVPPPAPRLRHELRSARLCTEPSNGRSGNWWRERAREAYSAAVERDPLSAFLEAEAAYRAGLDQLNALASDRDDALLAASRASGAWVTVAGLDEREVEFGAGRRKQALDAG